MTTFVQTNSVYDASSPTTGDTCAFPLVNTPGNLLVALFQSWQNTPQAVQSVSDSLGNSWARQGSIVQPGNGNTFELWAAYNCLGGSNTLTIAYPASVYWLMAMAEYAGIQDWASLDVFVATSDSSQTSHSSGNTAPARAGDLIIGGYSDSIGNAGPRVADEKTVRVAIEAASDLLLCDWLAASNGPQSASFTTSIAVSGNMGCWCFQAAPPQSPPARVLLPAS